MIHHNKFGMFIHWGAYSIWGVQEQYLSRSNMPNEEYEKIAMTFNPQNYDPESWVLAAKKAGMKYICFTTKHHDGFCMWDTKYTDYNIMNTPYKKDVLKMLSQLCEKHGILLSLYYSNPDWHHEYGYNDKSTHQWRSKNRDSSHFDEYKEFIKNQITELLTNYGKIYTLFWDIPPCIEDRSMNEYVRELQPEIIINNRGFDEGDFSTPERSESDALNDVRFTKMTEACNSVGEQSWGYRKNEDCHSVRFLTNAIDKMMSRGASYLLNVGPKSDGTIDEISLGILERVGEWYNRMEGCLEEHNEDSFPYEIRKNRFIVNKKNGKSYFHFFDGVVSSAVSFDKYPNIPKKVRLLNTGAELKFDTDPLPGFFDMETGMATPDILHISGIPVDDLASEPIVIEIEW